jgi:hypothetical protein
MIDLSTLDSASGNVWTRGQALRLAPPSTLRGLLADGSWQRLWPGVYADGGELTAEQRGWAAVLASGITGAVACGRTAARLWGFPLVDDQDPATGRQEHRIDEVIAPAHRRTLRVASRELRRHRFVVRPGDVVRTPRGLAVTSPVRTLVDCTALLAPEAAVCALDDALHRRVVAAEELHAAVVNARGRPGVVALATALALSGSPTHRPKGRWCSDTSAR